MSVTKPRCDICNVEVTSDQCMPQHVRGQKHKKKAKKHQQEAEKHQQEAEKHQQEAEKHQEKAEKHQQEAEKHQQKAEQHQQKDTPALLQRPKAPVIKAKPAGSAKPQCDICDVKVTSKKCLPQHMVGRKHQQNAVKHQQEADKHQQKAEKHQQKDTPALLQRPKATVVKAKPAGFAKPRCDICDVEVTSKKCLPLHVLGRKHQEKVEKLQQNGIPAMLQRLKTPVVIKAVPAGLAELRCDTCNVEVTANRCMEEHVLGQEHQQRAEKHQDKAMAHQQKAMAHQQMAIPAGVAQPRCDICGDVELTSKVETKKHLLSEQHQQKAKVAPHGERGILVTVTKKLSNVEIRDIYGVFTKFGELSDFRFSVVQKGEAKPKHMSEIYVKYQTKAAGRKARLASQKGQLMCGDIVIKIKQDKTETKEQKKKKKKEEEASRDPIDHTRLLTRLGQMLQTQSEDDVISWLAYQLLLTPDEYQQRVQFCQDIQAALRSQFPTCLMQLFGSSLYGLGFHGCDLDMYAFIDASNPNSGLPPNTDDKEKVVLVAKKLKRHPERLCTHIVRIPSTRVPIVKFRAPRLGGIQCDLSFRSPLSCQKSQLVRWMMKADPRARLVTVAVRYWAKRRQLGGGDRHPLKMTSYCLTLLVVTFLQQLQPPVLPSVDWCQAPVEELLIGPWNSAFAATAVWRSTNTTPASQLLRQFFRFYADFAAELEALCPLRGGPVPRAQLTDRLAGRQLSRPTAWADFCDLMAEGRVESLAVDTPLVLQDPMELNYNVARNLRQLGLSRFRQCCREAVDMPLSRLFDEEALPKTEKPSKKKKKAAAAGLAAAADSRAENGSMSPADGDASPVTAAG